jgi:nicotinamidase/pyrazinamidase
LFGSECIVTLDQLQAQFENIIIAGEAKSHCIANTLKQILELEKYSFNLTVLDDCMSPVPGFEKIADPIYQKARDAGVQFIKSKDLILT